MSRTLLLVLILLAGAPPLQASARPPPVATARCRDGTFSHSLHHPGTCSDHGGVATWLDGSGGSSPGGSPAPAGGLRPVVGQTVLLGRRSQVAGCTRGVEPDRRCSPGAYYSKLTRAVICSSTFHTSAIRDVPQSEKFAVEREYGMPARLYGYTIEIDHIVPLEIGGSNDIANLFPEPGSGNADYHVKDLLENRLHAFVCADRMTLPAAQAGIATDWEGLYRTVFGEAP